MISEEKIWRGVYWTVIGTLSLLMGLLYLAAYPIVDDLWFSTPGYESMTLWERLSLSLTSLNVYLRTDMMRLANVIAPFMNMVAGRTAVSAVYTLLCMLSMEGWRRSLSIKVGSWTAYAIPLLFFLILPWYDYLLATSYMLNYVLSTVLTVWVIYGFERLKTGMSVAEYCCWCVTAFLAGWNHEGFAVPLMCGLVVWMAAECFTGKVVSWRRILLTVFTGLGVLLIFCGPTFGSRSRSWFEAVSAMPSWEFMIQLAPSLSVSLAAVVLSVPAVVRRWYRPRLLMLLTAALTAQCISLAFYSGPRTTWPAMLFSLMVLVSLPEEYDLRGLTPRCVAATAFAVLMLVSCHLLYAIRSQVQLTEEYRTIMQLYSESETGEVYADVTTPKADLSLLKTTVRVLTDYHSLAFISLYQMGLNDDSKNLTILPEALEGFDADTAGPESSRPSNYVYNGLAVTADTIDPDGRSMVAHMVTESGEHLTSRCRPIVFHGRDGKESRWIMMHAQTLSPTLRVKSWYLE
ncbi:MAG: hypothetical protein K2M03_04245 [Muribaculaceae bacterium]|nr:hypothetical protein [Muribaculaceae bacterium]